LAAGTDCAVQIEPSALGYSHFEVGLNNQKLALFGLLMLARDKRLPVVLPEFSVFNPALGVHGRTPLDSVFPVEGVYRVARAWGIGILTAPPIGTTGAWDCFVAGSTRVSAEGARGLASLDDVAGQFFRNLAPRLAGSDTLRKLSTAVFADQAIRLVVQLRIEKDWARYSADTLAQSVHPSEEYHPSFLQIMQKIRNTLGHEADAAYVVCDEADLPVSKDEIREAVMATCGIRLVWKSDVLAEAELAAFTSLDRSILDFEMAVSAPVFTGLSRSTFSNMVSFEVLCRTRKPAPRHYIYNLPGERLGRRCENGARIVPHEVTNSLYMREPLRPPAWDDIHWRASLIAHIASFGDLVSEAAPVVGVYGGALVAGCRFAGEAKAIEGFGIVAGISSLSLEYRAKRDDGIWTGWVANGTFIGTRAQSSALLGFAVRLTGPLALGFTCLCIGSFVGKPDLVHAGPGQDCVTDEPRKLEAMQIVFRRL